MFNYFGAKEQIVNHYPKPIHDSIVEPFCGSARYSIKHWKKNVTICDKSEQVIMAWKYMKEASKGDLINLPFLKVKDNINDFNLSLEEKCFLGFCISIAPQNKKNVVTSLGIKRYRKNITNIANQLYKIKHWIILENDYFKLENKKATWFIDPPYQHGGHEYKESNKNINFNDLSKWCKSRKGQIIVCENTKANWMDFKPMVKLKGIKHITTEAIWTNFDTAYNAKGFFY